MPDTGEGVAPAWSRYVHSALLGSAAAAAGMHRAGGEGWDAHLSVADIPAAEYARWRYCSRRKARVPAQIRGIARVDFVVP